jgi:8-hydroxy-5-deazaflavin:NADPH oxidoreductase
MQIGIIGAGNIGTAVARLAVQAKHEVMLARSREPQALAPLAAEIGCGAGTVDEAAAFGSLILLAIPLKNYPQLPQGVFAGKIVMDAGNYYPDRDGVIAPLEAGQTTTSQWGAQFLGGASIVKAFNSILADHILRDAKSHGTPDRRALPIAGDDPAANARVAGFLDGVGFDVVDAGPLSESWRFERARPVYCRVLDRTALADGLAETTRTDFVPHGSWRM